MWPTCLRGRRCRCLKVAADQLLILLIQELRWRWVTWLSWPPCLRLPCGPFLRRPFLHEGVGGRRCGCRRLQLRLPFLHEGDVAVVDPFPRLPCGPFLRRPFLRLRLTFLRRRRSAPPPWPLTMPAKIRPPMPLRSTAPCRPLLRRPITLPLSFALVGATFVCARGTTRCLGCCADGRRLGPWMWHNMSLGQHHRPSE